MMEDIYYFGDYFVALFSNGTYNSYFIPNDTSIPATPYLAG
jgi:hypothetical protein